MVLSVTINIAIFILAVACVADHTRRDRFRTILCYFTTQSNLLCAAACLATAVCRICGRAPNAVLLLKYVGTCAVTVTLLTVFLFLGPAVGYLRLLKGPNYWLHLGCPVLALLTYFAWDKPAMTPWHMLLGMLPVALYGLLYMYKVLFAPEGKRWNDFYGFNKAGKWKRSFAAMMGMALAVSAVLYA